MEVIEGSIYDWPKYYEFIFGSDWRAETEFLQACFERYVLGGQVKRLYEPACGTGRLMFRLGKLGYDMAGTDLNEKAVKYCNARLKKSGLQNAQANRADMCQFVLSPPADAAFNTINSFRHLATDEQAVSHLECVSRSLRSGGIYVLGLHLSPTEGEADEEESWTHRRGHLQVNASMWLVDRDMRKRSERFALAFDIYTPSRQFRIQDEFAFRMYTWKHFRELIGEVPDFELVDVFDFSYEIDWPLKVNAETQDAVFILRKR